MDLSFFFFLVFMSIASFAMVFIVYVAILKIFGDNRWIEMIVIPTLVLAFDFTVMIIGDEYKYFVGSIPLAVVAGMIGYAYFFKGEAFGETNSVKPIPVHEEKKYSAKSARIHAAREKLGRK